MKIHKYFSRMRQSLLYISHHPLASRNLISAYYRYFSFHIVQLANKNRPRKYPFVGGVSYYAFMGEAGIVGNIYTGLEDFEEMVFLLHFLRTKDVFMDVGANVGEYALLASGICRSRSIAIEPIPSTYDRLVANVKLNGLENHIECLNIGLGRQDTTLQFIDSPYSVMNRPVADFDKSTHPQVTVKIKSLDEIAVSEGMPILLKIDVEGFELEVLKGACECLEDERLMAIIIELNGSGQKYGFTDDQVFSFIVDKGFSACRYDPCGRDLLVSNEKDSSRFNTIFIRNHKIVSERVKAASKVNILSQAF